MSKSVDDLMAISNDKTADPREREVAIQSLSNWLMRKRLDFIHNRNGPFRIDTTQQINDCGK